MNAATGWLLGLLLGMRHALEPDHLAAVSTLVAEERGAHRGALLGAFWGLGHTVALLTVGLALAVLQASLPARVADAFELGVALMLIGLGLRALRVALREGRAGPLEEHAHHGAGHSHAGPRSHVHVAGRTLALRPLLVGAVHGLAGSGALTALVMAGLPGTFARLSYMALFGFGSVLGMGLLSGLAGWPLQRLASRPLVARALAGATGLFSTALGAVWGWPLVGRLLG